MRPNDDFSMLTRFSTEKKLALLALLLRCEKMTSKCCTARLDCIDKPLSEYSDSIEKLVYCYGEGFQ